MGDNFKSLRKVFYVMKLQNLSNLSIILLERQMKKGLLLFLLLVFFCTGTSAQEKKYEREVKVKSADIPVEIHWLLRPYVDQIKKLKFYKETDGDHESYEAKFFYNQAKYSVEFSRKPERQDIEVLVPWSDVDDKVRAGISDFLAQFDKHRIEKIQQQFSSKTKTAEEVFSDAWTAYFGDIICYELEVEVKEKGSWVPYELLFNDQGQLLNKREVSKRSADFILY
jgi:hypothetical protein